MTTEKIEKTGIIVFNNLSSLMLKLLTAKKINLMFRSDPVYAITAYAFEHNFTEEEKIEIFDKHCESVYCLSQEDLEQLGKTKEKPPIRLNEYFITPAGVIFRLVKNLNKSISGTNQLIRELRAQCARFHTHEVIPNAKELCIADFQFGDNTYSDTSALYTAVMGNPIAPEPAPLIPNYQHYISPTGRIFHIVRTGNKIMPSGGKGFLGKIKINCESLRLTRRLERSQELRLDELSLGGISFTNFNEMYVAIMEKHEPVSTLTGSIASEKPEGTESSPFEDAAKPLMKYLCDHHHPHTAVYVTPINAEVLEGVRCFETHEFLND